MYNRVKQTFDQVNIKTTDEEIATIIQAYEGFFAEFDYFNKMDLRDIPVHVKIERGVEHE